MKKYLCILYLIVLVIFNSCVDDEFEYFDNCDYYNNVLYCKIKTHEDFKDNNEELNTEIKPANITEIITPSEKEIPNNEELNTEDKDHFYFNIDEKDDSSLLSIEIPDVIYNDVKYLDDYGLISFSINNTDRTFSVILYDIDVNINDLMYYKSDIKTHEDFKDNNECITDLYYSGAKYSYPICTSEYKSIIISISKEFLDEFNKFTHEFVINRLNLYKIIYKNNQLELIYADSPFFVVN